MKIIHILALSLVTLGVAAGTASASCKPTYVVDPNVRAINFTLPEDNVLAVNPLAGAINFTKP
jgi:hypothetical protein